MRTSGHPAADVDALRDRLVGSADPLTLELVEELRTVVAALGTAEEELAQRHDELLELHAALAAEARRFQLLFDAAPLAYLVSDRSGTITEANDAAAELLATPTRFLRGKPLAARIDPTRRRAFRRALLELRVDGTHTDISTRMRRQRGVPFDAHLRAVAVGDEILWAVVDETLLEQAERRVWELNRELETRIAEGTAELEVVVDQLPVGLIVIGPDARITRASARAREILGVDEPVGRSLDSWQVTDQDGRPLADEARPSVRALAGGLTAASRFLLARRGEAILVEASAAPIYAEGGVAGAVLTCEDVTLREQKARSEREFVTNAAHQLRNPITAIASAVAALGAGAKDDAASRNQFLDHIERETTRMTRTVEALLRLARLERAGVPPERRLVRLCPLLEAVAANAAPAPGVAVLVDCADDVCATANDDLVREALENLVSNALRHTTRGGVTLRGRLANGEAIVEVVDTGSGIPHDVAPRIFERFFTAAAGRGAGLGLPLARQAAEAAGGALEYAGRNGRRGATFRLTLPGARLLP